MRTFKITLSYDGTDYHGWQVQVNGISVQQQVETAIARVLQQRVRVTASGRTDAGVHALGQVASFNVESQLSAWQIRRGLNGSLPPDIRVLHLEDAPPGFHALRDAKRKRYRYVIWDDEWMDVFQRHYAWHVRSRLDQSAMQQALTCLWGTHDFLSFQAAGSPRASTVRTVFDLQLQRINDGPRLELEIEADGFLYNMVRNIVGTLVQVGRGVQSFDWPAEVLAAKDRRRAGPTAPPHGLFLVRVDY
jgi:tRNA pseudouridine38-40 synthase